MCQVKLYSVQHFPGLKSIRVKCYIYYQTLSTVWPLYANHKLRRLILQSIRISVILEWAIDIRDRASNGNAEPMFKTEVHPRDCSLIFFGKQIKMKLLARARMLRKISSF